MHHHPIALAPTPALTPAPTPEGVVPLGSDSLYYYWYRMYRRLQHVFPEPVSTVAARIQTCFVLQLRLVKFNFHHDLPEVVWRRRRLGVHGKVS